jgi:hypothetical protein
MGRHRNTIHGDSVMEQSKGPTTYGEKSFSWFLM